MTTADAEKALAARAAAQLVRPGMRVGLGTGSTVAHLLTALAESGVAAVYVATSPRTEATARALGLTVEGFDGLDRLDLALDGADQVAPDGWLIKGGGGAHTREKIVAASADRFVVIVDSTKLVSELRPPVPVEVLAFGLAGTLARLGDARVRDAERSPDGGVIVDLYGAIGDPARASSEISATPGVVGHGLFEPALVDEVVAGVGDAVRRWTKEDRR